MQKMCECFSHINILNLNIVVDKFIQLCYHNSSEVMTVTDVVIEIRSTIVSDTAESVTVNTMGRMKLEGGVVRLYYDETDEDGAVTSTVIKAESDTVTIRRSGATSSCLIVRQGERYTSQYDVVYGSFIVGLTGRSVDVALDESGGRIALSYELDTDNRFLSNNEIEINVRRSY